MALNSHWMVTEMHLPFSRLNGDWKVTEWHLLVFTEWLHFVLWSVNVSALYLDRGYWFKKKIALNIFTNENEKNMSSTYLCTVFWIKNCISGSVHISTQSITLWISRKRHSDRREQHPCQNQLASSRYVTAESKTSL